MRTPKADFVGALAESIPDKTIVSDEIYTVSELNMYRDVADEYKPSQRYLPSKQERYEFGKTLGSAKGGSTLCF